MGLVLLAILLVAIARLLWRTRPTDRASATWAGVVAAALPLMDNRGAQRHRGYLRAQVRAMALAGLVLAAS